MATRTKNYRLDGKTMSLAYPNYNATVRVYDRMGNMRWREAVSACFNMIDDLHTDARRTDLDLAIDIDTLQQQIATLQKRLDILEKS